MKNSSRNMEMGKEMLNSDLRYFKRSTRRKAGHTCDDSDVTSYSSNASMHYRKFSAEALVLKALQNLADPKGSTVVAIKKYIINHYPQVDLKFTLPVIRKVIRTALLNGKVVLAQGTNMEGLFKISADEIRASVRKQQFKQVKACVKLRAQQRMELEGRVQASRAKEEQRRRFLQERQAARMKRQKEIEDAEKATKAKLTEQAARAMLGLVKQQPPTIAQTLLSQPNLRLSAGNSRLLVPKPQIVDYADAAIETAKVVSSEQMKKAIIKAAEYAPNLIPPNRNTSPGGALRSMPIKYERTVRSTTWDSFYPSYQNHFFNPNLKMPPSPEGPKLKEFFKKKKLDTKSKVNLLPSSQKSVVPENAARKKNVQAAKNVRKVTKRLRPKANTKTAFKITNVLR